MAAFDLEEQEQLDELKAWWKKYGNVVTWIALALAIGILAWTGWKYYQNKRGNTASGIYGALTQAVAAHDVVKARQLSGELMGAFDGTLQADLGALLASKAEIDANDMEGAKAKLKWAISAASDPAVRDLARLRLAGLLLDAKSYDEALKTLETEPDVAFAARFSDLRGDILQAKGSIDEARAAYTKALEVLQQQDGSERFRSFVQLKLEALGDA